MERVRRCYESEGKVVVVIGVSASSISKHSRIPPPTVTENLRLPWVGVETPDSCFGASLNNHNHNQSNAGGVEHGIQTLGKYGGRRQQTILDISFLSPPCHLLVAITTSDKDLLSEG